VSSEADVVKAVAVAEEEFGRLGIVHNNAAAMELVPTDRPVVDEALEHWDRVMAVNLRGQMLGCKHAVPAMLRCGDGSIINTSSASAVAGESFQTAYNSSTRNHLTPYIGETQDIANAVAFLAGDDSRFITHLMMSVDGGPTSYQGTYAELLQLFDN
jgi:NAD(P)-dependent dehydrogenase (short-subunit alcohol dehydrogenase family)